MKHVKLKNRDDGSDISKNAGRDDSNEKAKTSNATTKTVSRNEKSSSYPKQSGDAGKRKNKVAEPSDILEKDKDKQDKEGRVKFKEKTDN